MVVLAGHEKCIVIEPVALLLAEQLEFLKHGLIRRVGEGSPGLFQKLCLKLDRRTVIDLARIKILRAFFFDVLFCQQICFDQQIRADDQRLSGKCGKALIRGIAEAGRAKRQHLPQCLTGPGKKINEIVSARTEITDAVRGRERGRMDQDARHAYRFFFFDLLRFCLCKFGIHKVSPLSVIGHFANYS